VSIKLSWLGVARSEKLDNLLCLWWLSICIFEGISGHLVYLYFLVLPLYKP